MKLKSIFYMLFLGCLFTLSCKQELIGVSNDDYALVIEYDVEEKSYQDNSQIVDSSLLTTSDIIASEIFVKKYHWKIQVKEDGTCRKEVIYYENKSTGDLKKSIFDKTNAIKTVVYENNKAHYFNESGTLLYSLDSKTPLETELIAQFSKSKNTANKPQLKNESFNPQNIEMIEDFYEDKDFGYVTERLFFDTTAQVLIKSELYNASGELLFKDSISYTQYSPKHYVPYQEWSFSFIKNIHNQSYTGVRQITHSNITIINNL